MKSTTEFFGVATFIAFIFLLNTGIEIVKAFSTCGVITLAQFLGIFICYYSTKIAWGCYQLSKKEDEENENN